MTVDPVQGPTDLRAFIDLPFRLHAQDPVWVPPLRSDMRARLSRYCGPAVVQRITEDLDQVQQGMVSDEAEVSVLFADLTDVTPMAENRRPS